jgi:hypothetical protein
MGRSAVAMKIQEGVMTSTTLVNELESVTIETVLQADQSARFLAEVKRGYYSYAPGDFSDPEPGDGTYGPASLEEIAAQFADSRLYLILPAAPLSSVLPDAFLQAAIWRGDCAAAEYWLAQGANPDSDDGYGYYSLFREIRYALGNTWISNDVAHELVAILVRAGGTPREL